MVSESRFLTPRHARRAILCERTRKARRDIARNRVRRPLYDIGNCLLRNTTNIQSTHDRADGAVEINHCTELDNTSLHRSEHIILEDELSGENAHNRESFCEIHRIYAEGDYAKVEKYCLSIHRIYPEEDVMIEASMLPLSSGKCLVHNLGSMDYTCEDCEALCWKSEGKRIKHFAGKYCCASGQTKLLPLLDPPDELKHLLHGGNPTSKNFLRNIRAYNSALAFASLGAHVDERFINGRGVYTFRVHGQIYHNIGSLMPTEENVSIPRFAQLYFYDTEHELQNRLHHVSGIDERILSILQDMMHRDNPYAQAFRSAGAMMQTTNSATISMIIAESRSNGWQYLAPRGAEVAAIMPGHGHENTIGHRDILINLRAGGLKKISNLHRSYMPLLYVLLFPRGEDGWFSSPQSPTQKEYYAFRLQVREDTVKCLLRGGRLLQQYIVDAYSSMEESRLVWMRNNQRVIRAELYRGLVDMVETRDSTEETAGRHAGKRVVLPSSFIGGPRYMHQLYQDSMAIVRKRGKPDLFITFTCNPRWKEIEQALLPGQETSDRPDLVSRVFYQKFIDMMHLLTTSALFGDVVGHVSVIEFQKRGLPHAHILLILASGHKPSELLDYNKLVCAELPKKDLFPELFDVISRCNVHGPCGDFNRNAPCMIEGRCRFKYPRRFCASTIVDDNGYPTYMRRDDGKYIVAKGKKLDNRWIVPYNPFLSMRYKAHINVEICSTISAVKYLYKYIYKGHDRATVVMQDTDGVVDEIKSYIDARYVSSSEALWRIYGFDLHKEKPDVQRLQVHLPNENTVHFRDSDDLREVIDNDANKKTTLTEWFVTNQVHANANDLLYIDFPDRWVWNKSQKCWTSRQRGDCIGRMYNIVPTAGDLYFMRMLLTVCKGSKSFEELRTFNGCSYPTFKDACNARGMLQSDEEWTMCLDEASFLRTGMQLRELFAIILVYCMPVSPELLWMKFCVELSEDHYHVFHRCGHSIEMCRNMANNEALQSLDSILKLHGRSLSDYPGMPQIDTTQLRYCENTLLAEERMFNVNEQLNIALHMEQALNQGQRDAYYKVLEAIGHESGSVFFLDGPGGSGKTYVYNALLSRVRAQQKIALACASSGIAALLLSNGRTAHSRFKIPINLTNESTCNIKVTSLHAELLTQASLIVWDEAPMMHRYAFEALDRTLRDIMQSNSLFGGKVMLFGGDFRQVLPVVCKGRREDIVDASLCHSFIWEHIQVLRLTENMRLVHSNIVEVERDFAKWVLDIGNGDMYANNVDDDMVLLPSNMLLRENCVPSLIDYIYADIAHVDNFTHFFKERGILAPRNKDVDVINSLALCRLGGVCKEYLSADSMCSSDEQSFHLYTLEFLNSIDLGGGFPPHVLFLKENAPVILLRNLDPRRGLCNGTRLICKQLYDKVIEAEIITGKNTGDRVLIPRIDFISSSSLGLPFEMKRRQFPIKLAFGMTINKAQGQTLGILGLYLASPVFSHGQLYVAMSRVKSSNAIRVVVDDRKIERQPDTQRVLARTPNIVYKEVLQLANAMI